MWLTWRLLLHLGIRSASRPLFCCLFSPLSSFPRFLLSQVYSLELRCVDTLLRYVATESNPVPLDQQSLYKNLTAAKKTGFDNTLTNLQLVQDIIRGFGHYSGVFCWTSIHQSNDEEPRYHYKMLLGVLDDESVVSVYIWHHWRGDYSCCDDHAYSVCGNHFCSKNQSNLWDYWSTECKGWTL